MESRKQFNSIFALLESTKSTTAGSVTLPNIARNKSPGTSGSRRSDDFTPRDLVAWRLCEVCLDVEAASIMLLSEYRTPDLVHPVEGLDGNCNFSRTTGIVA